MPITMRSEEEQRFDWHQLENLYNACRDYGSLTEGDEWPTWEQVKQAYEEDRCIARDDFDSGSISIYTGENRCFIEFDEV